MMKSLKTFLLTFLLWTLTGTVGHVLFLLLYSGLMTDAPWSERLLAVVYGLKLDAAIAAYLTVIPGLLLLIGAGGRRMKVLWSACFALFGGVYALAIVANLGLYGPWGFPLDYTPILYLTTSPAEALASATLWQMAAAAVTMAGLTWGVWRLRPPYEASAGWGGRLALLLLTVALILPMRGGLSTGTNHTGTVYFSENIRLNHAAVNPVFSFIESAAHREDLSSQYRFMSDEEAELLVDSLNHETDSAAVVPRDSLFTAKPERIVLVILESFSTQLMEEAGLVKDVVPRLEQMAAEGLYFTRFYSNTMRTDRALVSVLSAIPAFPTYSLMDQPRKTATLPSLATALKQAGYAARYYYGGDTNFSNMRSYLVAAGFQDIVSEKDFPASQRTGKWGVADGPVFDRAADDLESMPAGEPLFAVVQTSSSHEPFDVPDHQVLAYPPLNAFHYADSCLGHFVDRLRSQPGWERTLVVMVPDHQGCYPVVMNNYALEHYHVPLVMTGGVVRAPRKIDTLGSQTDLAATLLSLVGASHEAFPWSKDLLDGGAAHYAVFAVPDAVGMVREEGALIWDNTSARVMLSTWPEGQREQALQRLKAYYQKLYKMADRL